MTEREKHHDKLVDHRLRKIENKLKRIEILILKNSSKEKKIKKELDVLEKEERVIEAEERKLQEEEVTIIRELKRIELEEQWALDIRYHCKAKFIEKNVDMCMRTGKLCNFSVCPLVRK